MSNITLRIGGRDYAVACAEGEEAHVTSLGHLIDDKVRQMGSAGQSEPRQLLFAALLLADELHEAQGRLAGASSAASVPAPAPSAPEPDHTAELLEAIATRLENCAAALEG